MSASSEVQYHVLPDRSNPYLLARVRWPDVAQAISAARPEWQQDPGLFDLPYDPNSVSVSADEAAAIAESWGARPPSDTEVREFGPQLIRRMPANWSNLSPAEVRAWSLDLVVTRSRRKNSEAAQHAPARFSSLRARLGGRKLPAQVAESPLVAADLTSVGAVSTNGTNGVAAHSNGTAVAATPDERRGHVRVGVAGRARIRCGWKTISAELVDVGKGGMHCIVSDGGSILKLGGRLDAPLTLEGNDPKFKVRLKVAGTVAWRSDNAVGTHLGVAFDALGALDDEALDQLQDLLAS